MINTTDRDAVGELITMKEYVDVIVPRGGKSLIARISADAKVHVAVPVVFINETASPGLKKGGVINIVRHELELVCEPGLIPNDIQIDVTGLEVGAAIHISHVKLPAGVVSAITDRDFTIATIVAPSSLKSEAGDAASV